MYILYYLNENLQLGTIERPTLDIPIVVPERLIFCALRKGINFIKEPHECLQLTHIERLIFNSEFTDISMLKTAYFRRENTLLTATCQIEPFPNLILSSPYLPASAVNVDFSFRPKTDFNLFFSNDGGVTYTKTRYYFELSSRTQPPKAPPVGSMYLLYFTENQTKFSLPLGQLTNMTRVKIEDMAGNLISNIFEPI
ncbi:hypothetical protein [Flavobacterium crassostreae]|uniref:Uncharacterized protein n=1 Tax=Flavobacterium crassostreae TaxID=1763534 RepID=A0A1B9EA51_9FLAO|nr:hypothetical protein [Flavobacterium crassostreae]OCB78817.1 hypothetical protein LPBF_00060 [Flavobacterium crassostreae]